jgi:hypothetical protein
MVTVQEGLQIYQDWVARGSPPCEHPRWGKEMSPGSWTGEYICLDCATEIPHELVQERRRLNLPGSLRIPLPATPTPHGAGRSRATGCDRQQPLTPGRMRRSELRHPDLARNEIRRCRYPASCRFDIRICH